MKKMVSIIVGTVIFPVTVFAARPLSVNDAGTVGRGNIEIEYGIEHVKGFDNETEMGLVLTFGVGDTLDAAVEVPYIFIDAKEESDSDGFADVGGSLKWNLVKEKGSFPDSALVFGYMSESGNDERGVGAGRPEYSLACVFSKTFEPFTAHLNIGYAFRKDFEEEDNEDGFTYGLAFEYALNEKFNLVGEVVGETVLKREFNDNVCAILFGFNYAIADTITLDLGVGTGMSRADFDLQVTYGITIAL
ncbi:MAG: transporter [Candidatus Omnitrophica bacterium]|nr:transporter [Candidatus Omnitrophota bacterium]